MKRSDWLLILLYLPGNTNEVNQPMDRIRIMKSLFLLSNEVEQQLPNFYQFSPYLYGPFSLDVYTDLDELDKKGLVMCEMTSPLNWSRYRLTRKGVDEAKKLSEQVSDLVKTKLQEVKNFVTSLSFTELLRYIYKKYPDYATCSVIKVL